MGTANADRPRSATGRNLTSNSAATLMLDGLSITPSFESETALVFDVPAGSWHSIRLRSRSAAPAWTRGSGDFRILGIAVEGLDLSQAETKVAVAASEQSL